ncbi:MAG: formamidopyrimidine-DNA glycosylase [Planctomycetota bacterium]|nr:formamidopyrimidine-DNA glycosylase [Planctomycetota bacterium]
MPELPDIQAYQQALRERLVGKEVEGIRLQSPFLLRSVEPALESCAGRVVRDIRRIGKRIVLELDQERFLVLHLMIAGRLHWRKAGAGLPGKAGLAAFDFEDGSLTLTEAGSKRRASLYVVQGEAALAEHDRGGADVFALDLKGFRHILQRENHTLKRSLIDPRFFSGIGNAYSDEILHHAGLSPLRWSSRLDESQTERLFDSCREVLTLWCDRLISQAKKSFPEKVTAFRPDMAVHGKFGKPCPQCAAPVQRIVYASRETNYCAPCQTNGKLLADRALSQLLKKDWPRTLEELEARRQS